SAVSVPASVRHPGPPPPPVAPTPAAQPATLRELVEPLYFRGVPYDQARSLGARMGSAAELKSLFNDPTMTDARSNIVVTLGMIGGQEAEDFLKGLVSSGTGKLLDADVSLRLDAQMALGYAANIAPGTDTLVYLIDSLDPSVWDKRLTWQLPSGQTPVPRLQQRSVIALGLSGKDRARVVLQSFLSAPRAGRRGGGGSSFL